MTFSPFVALGYVRFEYGVAINCYRLHASYDRFSNCSKLFQISTAKLAAVEAPVSSRASALAIIGVKSYLVWKSKLFVQGESFRERSVFADKKVTRNTPEETRGMRFSNSRAFHDAREYLSTLNARQIFNKFSTRETRKAR